MNELRLGYWLTVGETKRGERRIADVQMSEQEIEEWTTRLVEYSRLTGQLPPVPSPYSSEPGSSR